MRDFTDWYFSLLAKTLPLGFFAYLAVNGLGFANGLMPAGVGIGTLLTIYIFLMFFPRSFFERHPRFAQYSAFAICLIFVFATWAIAYFDYNTLPVGTPTDDPKFIENSELISNFILMTLMQSGLGLLIYLTSFKNTPAWDQILSKVMVRASVLAALLLYFVTIPNADRFIKHSVLGLEYEYSSDEIFKERLRTFELKNLESSRYAETSRAPASFHTLESKYQNFCDKKRKAFDRMYSESWRHRFLTFKVEDL